VKLALLWLVALVTAGSCSISHRSNDFACQNTSDCAFGRICSDGVCVSILPIDAGVTTVCPSQCTSCNIDKRTCAIDCALNGGACNSLVTCPAGWSCDIACSTGNSCRSGIDCADSNDCTVTCSGTTSCRNITCGSGRCDVDCTGINSCRAVDCGAACACDITCHDVSLCIDITCKDIQCFADSINGGCSSTPRDCDTCN